MSLSFCTSYQSKIHSQDEGEEEAAEEEEKEKEEVEEEEEPTTFTAKSKQKFRSGNCIESYVFSHTAINERNAAL